jgi:hypothetical protein
MNPVECHTGDIQKLALSGTNYESWDDIDRAFLNAVSYRNSERMVRGKTFRAVVPSLASFWSGRFDDVE